uniref:Fibroblast activation protein, alpha n=1 Tax=Myripristis murdjan TaxID=586833 RepID=A0A668AL59_9TELE
SQGCSKVLWGVVGAAAVITLIAVPVAVHLKRAGGAKRTYTLADYFNDTIRWKGYNFGWISDNEYVHKTSEGHVFLHNAETKEESLYLSNSTFWLHWKYHLNLEIQLDEKGQKHLINDSNVLTIQQQWRHSYTASYSIYDMENFNIYLKSDVTAETVQVTHNGKKNEILNGVPDWVYEEEVFASDRAVWWSSTGKFLAYIELNDTDVQKVEFSWYGSDQYPQTVTVPYPKVGCSIMCPSQALNLILDRTQVLAPTSIASGDHFLSSVTWVTDERIAVQWITRKQNYVLAQIYDFDGGSWKEKQQTSKTGWVGHYNPLPLFFAEDNLSFYKVMSDTYGYKHIHYVKDGKATPITSGKWEVIYISKLTKDAIYYVSNEYQGRPGQRNLYKIVIGSGHSAPQCLTCGLYKDRCQYYYAYFSYDLPLQHTTFTHEHELIHGQFSIHALAILLCFSELAVLEENKELKNILSEFQMPTMKRGTLRIADLWYQMMLPPNFKKSKKYPLLIDVYAGPCSQRVDFRYRLNWGSYLSSTEGIIYASFDGRGSGYQGDKIMHSIYQRLGTYEVEDQITAVRKFIDMGFIDKDRIAIWGWSYGGYVTSMVLGAGTGLFKCGIAVAPVAKWEYYDAVYTERYMSKPTENSEAYKNSTVTGRAKNFTSVDYLLVHGTADDNVHFQQAAQISKALVDEKVDFEAMWYADKDHSLGGSAFRHLYTLMSNFLQKCLVSPK